MNIFNLKKQTWRNLLLGELALLLIFTIVIFSMGRPQEIINMVFVVILILLNLFQDKGRIMKNIVTVINIAVLPALIGASWYITGNMILRGIYSNLVLEVAFVIIWLIFLAFLPFPLIQNSASRVHNWFLRLLTSLSLMILPSAATELKIKGLHVLQVLNKQGVIQAVLSLLLICLLVYSWGYRFNPNLRFSPSKNFSWPVLITIIIISILDLCWNDFGYNGKTIWSMYFTFTSDPFRFTWSSLARGLEAGIFEETCRYIWIIILLAAFNRFSKWRVPVAIYGSTLLFMSMHISNIGANGQTVAATIEQILATSGAMMWAALYLYSGKLWATMLLHFFYDFFIFLQEGINTPATWNGNISDWASFLTPLILGFIVTIWMLTGKKRRQVMEENADRLLNQTSKPELPTFIEE